MLTLLSRLNALWQTAVWDALSPHHRGMTNSIGNPRGHESAQTPCAPKGSVHVWFHSVRVCVWRGGMLVGVLYICAGWCAYTCRVKSWQCYTPTSWDSLTLVRARIGYKMAPHCYRCLLPCHTCQSSWCLTTTRVDLFSLPIVPSSLCHPTRNSEEAPFPFQAASGPTIWNSLPPSFRTVPTFEVFKSGLKTLKNISYIILRSIVLPTPQSFNHGVCGLFADACVCMVDCRLLSFMCSALSSCLQGETCFTNLMMTPTMTIVMTMMYISLSTRIQIRCHCVCSYHTIACCFARKLQASTVQHVSQMPQTE